MRKPVLSGHHVDEYREMFALSEADVHSRLLEYGCGASAVNKELPLPFEDFAFDFALSSHYLLADLDDLDVDFHLQAIRELARVAKEVRIFPLIDRYGQPSPFLGPVLLGLQQEGYGVEVREVKHHLQPTGNAMLRVWAQKCQVS